MAERNVVDWHTEKAVDFDRKYTKNKAFIERYELWTKTIDKYSKPRNHVLDLGCGSGILSCYLSQRNESVIGVDASSEMLKICKRKKQEKDLSNLSFLNHDINSLGKSLNEKVDLIVCSSVLEYLDNLGESLRLLTSLMKEKGILIFSLPNKLSLYRRMEPLLFKLTSRPKYYEFIRNVCSYTEIELELKTIGLNILENAYYAKTPILSKVMHGIGRPEYSDNLIIIVAQRV